MRFTLDIEVDAKKNTRKLLNDLIERASKSVLKVKSVKMVDVRGVVVHKDDD